MRLDHVHRLKIAVDHQLHQPGVFLDELGRATEGVHHHRVLERGGDDLARGRVVAHRRKVGLVSHGRIVLPGDKGRGRSLRRQGHKIDILERHAVFHQDPGEAEIRRGARCIDTDVLALEIADLVDAGARGKAVGAVGLVQLHHLHQGHTGCGPADVSLYRRGGALHIAGGNRKMAVFLRDELDRHIDAVFLENACFFSQRQRRKAGPPAHRNGDLWQRLRTGSPRGKNRASGQRNGQNGLVHVVLP